MPCENVSSGEGWFTSLPVEVRARLSKSDQTLLDSLEQLDDWFHALRDANILAVIDRFVLDNSSVALLVRRLVSAKNVFLFDRISPNPSLETVADAAEIARQFHATHVLAIGGGSALDTAKLAALGACGADWVQHVQDQRAFASWNPLPIVAVPTTAGSGSEATPFAVVYLGTKKFSVAHPQLRPHTVVLDPRLALDMPPRLAAITGLDALAQSLESFWAVGSTDESRGDAQVALQLIVASLELSVLEIQSERRATMLVAAHLAGRAIAIGKTTAAHAISYTLTKGWNVPHGLAVALTLGHVAAWNAGVTTADCNDPRGVDHVRKQVERGAQLLQAEPIDLPLVIQRLLRRLGLPASLAEVGVAHVDIPTITASVDPVRLGNNPRRFTVETMNEMLQRASD